MIAEEGAVEYGIEICPEVDEIEALLDPGNEKSACAGRCRSSA